MAMERAVDDMVKMALKQDGRAWRLQNACPCCTYKVCIIFLLSQRMLSDMSKLEDEGKLQFSMIFDLDGNNSAKRAAHHSTATERFDSTYFLSPEEVDDFARRNKESKSKQSKKVRLDGQPNCCMVLTLPSP